ncbi:hypothetical protein [Mycobacterium sp.]|uniref:hypothetical protein n=1 Tax=Mycobacterium sp. TaxID=1785 RepID=UPI0025D8AED1|nr:hypothetical protein [Mycobacterium sp.]
MPHFRVDDALHSHPKAQRAGDEAMGMWARAGSFCMAYLTNGFVPDWWVKQQSKGSAKARRLVLAGLWHGGAEQDGETGYMFHEFVGPGRQDSREQIEADREKWRKKKQRQRSSSPDGSPDMSPSESPRDTLAASPRDSRVYTQHQHQPNTSGHLSTTAPEPNARDVVDEPAYVETGTRRTRRRPTSATLTVVRQVLGEAGYPRGTLERLAVQVGDLARDGHADALIRESLTEWDRRPDCDRPEFLPTVLGDLVKRSRAAPGAKGKSTSKLRAFAELAQQERARENSQLTNLDQPKELE